jgi:outer membrane protein TolC
VEYTRIAGPVSDNIQGVSGISQGVIIARINDDIALADFERNVHQMLHDVETLYWQLHLAYRTFAIQVESRDAALETWRTIDFQVLGEGGPGGAAEAEFRETYLTLAGQAETARDEIYAKEAQLRLVMGLPVNDGRVMRPCDEPITAELIPDWSLSLAQAYQHRPEIRRQKWNIRSLDLQRRAAENLTMPRLDFISGYQLNGFGDNLFSSSSSRYASAYQALFAGKQQGWNLGLQYSVPIGRRYAFAQVRNMELRLAKAQAMLAEQETEISHEIASVFRDLDRSFVAMENAFNRLSVSRERLRLTQVQYQSDPRQYTVEMVSRARQALTQAELAFATALLQYNTSIADLNYRTGRTLLVNNIDLHEGSWCPSAEADAYRRFEEREYAIPHSAQVTSPPPFASPVPVPSADALLPVSLPDLP